MKKPNWQDDTGMCQPDIELMKNVLDTIQTYLICHFFSKKSEQK